MQIVVALAILCIVVLLGFAALVYLKHSQDRALIKDLLEARQDIVASKKHSELAMEICSKMANRVHDDMKGMIGKLDSVHAEAAEARISAQTILKEYELNGIPLGYKRGQSYDALDGI